MQRASFTIFHVANSISVKVYMSLNNVDRRITWQFRLNLADGALSFTHVCVDNSQTVLEHHRSFL